MLRGAAHGLLVLFCLTVLNVGCAQSVTNHEETNKMGDAETSGKVNDGSWQLATFGSGCFWCTEAVFQQLRGVRKVVSGYAAGETENPTYEEVCSGRTGHAEVIQVAFDPAEVTYAKLLEVFWKSHDPTTRNRQGNDVGTQYRSIILYHDDAQKEEAERYKAKLDESGAFDAPIVTQIEPFTTLYPAEGYHQDYYNKNPTAGYCAVMIRPKVDKIRKVFADALAD